MQVYWDKNTKKKHFSIDQATFIKMIEEKTLFVRRYFLSAELFAILCCVTGPLWLLYRLIIGQTPVHLFGIAVLIIVLNFGTFLLVGCLKRFQQTHQLCGIVEKEAEKAIRLIEYNHGLFKPFKNYLLLPLVVISVVSSLINQADYWLPLSLFAGYLIFRFGAPLEYKWIHIRQKKQLSAAQRLLSAEQQ